MNNNKTELAKSTEKVNVRRLLEKDGELAFIAEGNVEVVLTMDLIDKLVRVPQGTPKPTDAQKLMFAYTCITQGLNPYLEEVWLTYLPGKGWTPLVAAQSRVRKAQSQPDYDGYEWGWITSDGVRHPAGRESKVASRTDIIGTWGCVYRKGKSKPFYHEIFIDEYKKESASGKGSWDTKELTMTLKVNRDQTHKFAYADKMGNLMTENEARFVSTNDVVSSETPRSANLLQEPKPETSQEIESLQGEEKAVQQAEPPMTLEEVEKEAKKKLQVYSFKCKKCDHLFDEPGGQGKIPLCPKCLSQDITEPDKETNNG